MEARKKSTSTAAGAGAGAGAAPPEANGYFSNYFPASPAGNARDTKPDLMSMLNKQSSRGQNGSGVEGCIPMLNRRKIKRSLSSLLTGGKSQSHAYKDGKHGYPNESSESPYFGSSVHYGGRDFYNSTPQKQTTEPPRNYKEEDSDGSATRGDWWQGSLYY